MEPSVTKEVQDILDFIATKQGFKEWTLIFNNGLTYEVTSSMQDELSMYALRDILFSMVQMLDKKYPLENGLPN